MEPLIAILFIVIIILIINQNSKLFQQLQKIEKELKQFQNNFKTFSTPVKKTFAKPIILDPVKPPVEVKPYESIFSVSKKEEVVENLISPEPLLEQNIAQENIISNIEEPLVQNKNYTSETQTVPPVKNKLFLSVILIWKSLLVKTL